MKSLYRLFLICFFLIDGFFSVSGQTTIDAEIRPRSEFRDGFNKPLEQSLKASFFTIQRTRLNFNFKNGILNSKITLQDTRVFGETDTKQPSSSTSGGVSVYEAWADLLLYSGTSLKIGRQGVQFEDGRLFSLSPWSNTGTSHDLAELNYQSPKIGIQLGYACNNESISNADTAYYSVSKMYKELTFLHLTKTVFSNIDLSLLAVDEGFVKSKTDLDLYHRYTTGGTVQFKKEKSPVSAFFTGYYQFGKSSSTVDLNAFLLAIKGNYKFSDKFCGLIGLDYYSGSESTIESDQTNTFNKLPYGVNHAFNGFMEYWASLPKGGLVNYYGGLSLKLNKRLTTDLTYYQFRLDKTMMVGTVEVQKNIGSEIDLMFNCKLSPDIAAQFAWCGYFVNDGTKLLKHKSTAVDTKFPQYAYVMLTITPKLYKTPQVVEN